MAFASYLQMRMCHHNGLLQFPIPVLLTFQTAFVLELNHHPLLGREGFSGASCAANQVEGEALSWQD